MKFNYTITTKKGKLKKGVIEAPTEADAERSLLEQDLIVVSIQKERKGIRVPAAIPIIGRISTPERIFFTRHLAGLIKAGVPLKEGLETIREQTKSSGFRTIINDLIESISGGHTLSASFARHPKNFDQLFISIIEVGEKSGTLEENLRYLSLQLEKGWDLRRKFIAAMMYPAIIFIFAILVAAGLIIFILPKLLPVFSSLDVELPITTKILIAIARFFENYGILSVLALVVAIFILRALAIIGPIRYVISRVFLVLPIFGSIIKNLNLALFSRTLGTLLRSGVSIVESLDIAAASLGNPVYQGKIKKASTFAKEGRSLGAGLEKDKAFFPVTLSKMIAVGEKSGNLEETLEYLAEFYEKEVDNLTTNLSNILQPILLIVVGVVVGFIALAIITPIYKFTESIGR